MLCGVTWLSILIEELNIFLENLKETNSQVRKDGGRMKITKHLKPKEPHIKIEKIVRTRKP